MSTAHEGTSVRGETPQVVAVPRQRGREINHRQWTQLVNSYLPDMWAAVGENDAPLELRFEACLLAWLRLAQRDEIRQNDQTRTWLVMTARIELGRALGRQEMGAQRTTQKP